MKITAFNQIHKDLGAKMVPYAGFEMPVQYAGVNQEHLVVRNGVGVFDVSHMGQFFIKGPEALELLQYIGSNDASKVKVGQAQYTCLTNEKGGIVDDLIIYRMSEDEWMLVVNASNIDKDWEWINKHNKFDVEIEFIVLDRKSTRLNSSHVAISYAVFCLKKKMKVIIIQSNYDAT